MNLIECQEFEYCVRVIDDIISEKTGKERLSQIVWNKNGSIMEAKMLRFDQYKHVQFYPKFINQGSISEDYILIGKSDKTFITPLRFKLFDFYKFSSAFADLEAFKNKLVLFDEIRKFVKEFDDKGKKSIGNKIYEVNFLNNNVKLPFLEIADTDDLQPICIE